MSRIDAAIARSADEFRHTVWPHFSDALGGGALIPVETVTDSTFAVALDALGMTDAWQVVSGTGIRGLATRIQWGPKSWDTWTIRKRLPSGRPTEYDKLTRDSDWHLPQYVIQAYVCDGVLLGAAAIQTSDLQQILRNGWHGPERRNPRDGNTFVFIPWLAARVFGFEIIERPARTGTEVAA